MINKYQLTALLPITILWGWVLSSADSADAGAWPLVLVVLVPWGVIDWIASGSGLLKGNNRLPTGAERILCYVFMGAGAMPLLSASAGIMALKSFKPEILPTLFGDGMDVGLICLFGLISTSTLRLLGWTDNLFTNSTASPGPGGGGGA
ncbi:hypothetical protein [Wenzhouxiangella sp. EGI_FJ10305]|uniref:hypothetical protein n=1 Tax=Wenzhouxiangella sp. EGI_FJ10305 TaxID=3243768 RepID=UPI0035DC3807